MLVYINTTKMIGNYFFIFALDKNSTPVYICVYKHETYFYVKTKLNMNGKKNITVLEEEEMKRIISSLKDASIDVNDEKTEKVQMSDSQFYSEKPITHYKVYIKNIIQLDESKKILLKANYNIAETLNTDVKILTDLGMKMCQWIEILPGSFKIDFVKTISNRKPIQYVTRSEFLKSRDDCLDLPPAKLILNIDAEAYSSRYDIDGSKAHPNPLIYDDVMYAYSLVLKNSTTKETIKSCIIFIADESKEIEINNGEVIKVKDEENLFVKFSELVREMDPDDITGYNIQKFDFNYMKIRSSCMDVEPYGRISPFNISINDPEYKNLELNIFKDKETYDTIDWEGAGKSWHSYISPRCYGRVIVDTFNLVKPIKVSKGAPGALQSHKLNDVGKFLTGQEKEDITYAETYHGYRNGDPKELSRIASYCIQDSILNWEVYNKMNGHVYLREAANMFYQDMNNVLISGLNAKLKDNYFLSGEKRNFCFYNYGNKRIFKIKGGHVETPLTGKKTNVACIDFSSMYPSAQIARNICLSTFSRLRPVNLSSDDYYEYDIDVEIDETEIPAFYEKFVPLFEVEGLEDEIYIDNFFKENKLDKIYKVSFLNIIREENKIPTKKNTEKIKIFFVKENIREGIFPRIEKDLKTMRSFYKKEMNKAKEKNDIANLEIYDQRQKLVKVVMNSIYGIMGSPKGTLSCIEASAAITHFGRECIKRVRDFLIEKGCTIIYGDTDSVMIQIPNYIEQPFDCEASQEVVDYVEKIVEEINNFLPSPMQVEFEKLMNMVAVKKKHYLGVKTWEGKKTREVFIKGLAGIRGDSTPFAQDLFRNVVDMITKNIDEKTIFNYISNQTAKLKNGEIPNDMLVVSSMLAHSYKSETAAMNVFSKYLKQTGNTAEPGTKIPYLVIKGNKKDPKSYNFRPVDTKEPLDYDHYYTRAIDPIKEIIYATFGVEMN